MASQRGVTMSTDELRARVFELGRHESALVEEAVANVYDSTQDPDTRRSAVTWALKAVTDIQAATFHFDPLVTLADQWALALQTETLAREGPGRKSLGDASVFVASAGRQMAVEAEKVATLVFGEDGVGQPRNKVAHWARANPINSRTFARPSASVALSRALGGQDHSALGFAASADDRLAIVAARLDMMNDTLVDRIRWTGELVVHDAFHGQEVASLFDAAQDLVSNEHDKLVNDLAQQRDQLFAQVNHQREAAFVDVARERATIFKGIAAEREAVTGQADALLRRADGNARALIDRTLFRVGVGAALLIVLAALAAWVVMRALRGPRRREPHEKRGGSTFKRVPQPTG